MRRTFGEVTYCVYENDSTDGSAEWARDLAARRGDVKLLSERGHTPALVEGRRSPWRFKRMAACRNRCLSLARTYAPGVDYAIVLDIDFAGFDQVYIAAAVREIDRFFPGWQALCGSGLSRDDLEVYGPSMRVVPTRGGAPVRLYDVIAMQTEAFPKPSSDRTQALAVAAMAGSALDPPVRVKSAFGGLAIYKPDPLYRLEYVGGECEHLSIHRNLRDVFMTHKISMMMA
jgi:hypothetical protein